MTWARHVKRVFGTDVETFVRCGGAIRVIASINEPALIGRILAHVRGKGAKSAPSTRPTVTA